MGKIIIANRGFIEWVKDEVSIGVKSREVF